MYASKSVLKELVATCSADAGSSCAGEEQSREGWDVKRDAHRGMDETDPSESRLPEPPILLPADRRHSIPLAWNIGRSVSSAICPSVSPEARCCSIRSDAPTSAPPSSS